MPEVDEARIRESFGRQRLMAADTDVLAVEFEINLLEPGRTPTPGSSRTMTCTIIIRPLRRGRGHER